ncbi:MAG: toll/interleukin-1 receptor domain-containing protein [Rubrivivax sp.]|nr:toll/interleukin-1 receptor domain-containing protein [Rubrivivax sp.]
MNGHPAASAPSEGAGVPDELFWDDLLAYLADRRVIPIIDTGAMLVDCGGQRQPLESLLARRLTERLRIDVGETPQRLDEVVRRQRMQAGRKDNLYLRLQQLLKEMDLAPPQALLDLAAVDAFDLVVSVSFDDLVVRAFDQVRHGGAPRTEVLAFAPNRSADLAEPRGASPHASVFHLMGRLSSAPDCVICDDDRLEFLHALQDDARRPKLLFDELRDNHLLLLGCRLPDWAARFFLRTAKGARLSLPEGDTIEVLVGPQVVDDEPLAHFLAAFRPGARLVAMPPEDFLAELRRRWQAAHPAAAAASTADAPPTSRGRAPADGAVFISYSRHDSQVAAQLADTLAREGVDVWLDRNELQPGDAWAQSILRGIENCSLFVPVISASTQREDRSRAYFWREWNTADDLALGMKPGEVFILPVVVDDTDPYRAQVPRRFAAANFAVLPGGRPDDPFVARVRELFQAYRRRIGHG